jgi:hypothetical protein
MSGPYYNAKTGLNKYTPEIPACTQKNNPSSISLPLGPPIQKNGKGIIPSSFE